MNVPLNMDDMPSSSIVSGGGNSGTLRESNEWETNQSFLPPPSSSCVSVAAAADVAVVIIRTIVVPEECLDKAWPILRIPATSLIGAGFKHINRLVTRTECIELCLGEREFKCKSASFRHSRRNNLHRQRERDFNLTPVGDNEEDEDSRGECILSREDKNSKPDAFRVANDDTEEYIENQCVAQGQQVVGKT